MAKPKKKGSPSPTPVKPYEPTPYEQKTLATLRARNAERPLAPRIKVIKKNGVAVLDLDHPDAFIASVRLLEALGSRDRDFLAGLLTQLSNAASQGREADEAGINFMLSMVKGIEPRDQVESMLAAQMAATHNATMTFARRLNHVDNIPQQDSAERAFNKLARTFALQVEALKRYRSSGGQTVRVEHVTVNEGGQALSAVSPTGGGGPWKNRSQPYERGLSISEKPPVFGNLEAHPGVLQGSRGAGLDRVPVPWRARWSAEGRGERLL